MFVKFIVKLSRYHQNQPETHLVAFFQSIQSHDRKSLLALPVWVWLLDQASEVHRNHTWERTNKTLFILVHVSKDMSANLISGNLNTQNDLRAKSRPFPWLFLVFTEPMVVTETGVIRYLTYLSGSRDILSMVFYVRLWLTLQYSIKLLLNTLKYPF